MKHPVVIKVVTKFQMVALFMLVGLVIHQISCSVTVFWYKS